MKVPDHLVAEVIDGELVASSWPGTGYARAEGGLFRALTQFDAGAWWIIRKVELHHGADVLVPHFMGFRRTRMPRLPDVPFFDVVPDWVGEVVSSSNANHVRERRMARYAMHGIEYVWILDTTAKGVEIYQRQGAGWYQVAVHQGTTRIRAVPFDAEEINLGPLWIA